MSSAATPMSGRRAEAARNDRRILDAARAVFVADPGAPIAAVAEQAGVGISALYRRYASKEELLRRLCADGLVAYLAAAEEALADEGDPWAAFARFMRRVVDADTHSLTSRLAGTFTPTDELNRDAATAQELNQRLFERTRASGAIRPDLDVNDLSMVFEQLASIRIGDEARTSQLWPCCWRPCALPPPTPCPAPRRPGRSSPPAGSRPPGPTAPVAATR
jgi:AcrR family transcriptional regulator